MIMAGIRINVNLIFAQCHQFILVVPVIYPFSTRLYNLGGDFSMMQQNTVQQERKRRTKQSRSVVNQVDTCQ
jgi:hypothetical protein